MSDTHRAARRLALAACLAAGAWAWGLDFGVSIAPWSFGTAFSGEKPAEDGLYGRAGLIAGIAPRLELEAFAVAEAAPSAGRQLLVGLEATFPILDSREKAYFNSFASLGFEQRVSLDLAGGQAALGGRYLSLRISPVAIGNPGYGRRDRIFSPGLMYGLGDGSLTFIWSFFGADFFPGGGR